MFKHIERQFRRTFKGKRRRPPPPLPPPPPPPPLPPPPSPPPPPPPPEPTKKSSEATPFLFPQIQSTILPDPSLFFSPELLSSPLPTNSFFQNFTLNNGDQPEFIHPYLIKSSLSSISVSYPSLSSTSISESQIFIPDLTISASQNSNPLPQKPHLISQFNDLSLSLDIPSSNLRFLLVQGSPFLTFTISKGAAISISTVHEILSFSFNNSLTKYTITLNNDQKWLIYSSSPINLTHNLSVITSRAFSGIVRIVALPNSDPECEAILDRFSSCYPVSGEVQFTKPFCLEYKWETKGWGDLLMLAHPLHLHLLAGTDNNNKNVILFDKLKYNSIDGELVGVAGNSWILNPEPVCITWHSIKGVKEESFAEIISVLSKDVEALNSIAISTNSLYSYGKLIARAARLAVIAEEVRFLELIPEIRKFLMNSIEPWLNGTLNGNGFVYDGKWGGIVTKEGAFDSTADFGFGMYNNHHLHLGYFLYAIAVLVKIDPAWGKKYSPQVYSLMADFMSMSRRSDSKFPRLRCFDLYRLHSWASGLTEFADGRNQESSSEAVNAYYSAALVGLAYGDAHLVSIGSILTALEIKAAQTWWQVREGEALYKEEFVRENKVVGVLWSNKRDSGLWFAPPDWKECRLGIQVLPILPITELLFSNVGFVNELVKWALPALGREGVGEGWRGFVWAMEAIYDRDGALEQIKRLTGFDDGNSLTNLLWWVHSRGKGGGGEADVSSSRVQLV